MAVEAVKNPSFEEPRKESIGDLLSMNNPAIVVPDWQRSYSWRSEHVSAFWSDLLDFAEREGPEPSGEYFLGSVVLVRTADGRILLLDGQQRLATSAILLSVLRDYIAVRKPDAAKQLQENYLAGHDHNDDIQIKKITLNVYDKEYFSRLILTYREGDYQEPKTQRASHKNIYDARLHFKESLGERLAELSEEVAYKFAQRLRKILLHHFVVIAVSSTDEDKAAEVFETLNDRGIGLSTPDLLRNLVIRRSAKGQEDEIVELWKEVVSFEKDSEIKNFLRHYWVSKFGDVKSQSLYREIKKTIQSENLDSQNLSRELHDAAVLYRSITLANTGAADVDDLLEHILGLTVAARAMYPTILAILTKLSDADAMLAIQCLLNVFVRHTIIGQQDNSRFENLAYKAARDLRGRGDLAGFLSQISNVALDDETVQRSFERLAVSHNGTRRYLLEQIELRMRGTEELRAQKPDKVHVEHIYPQTPSAGEKWADHGNWVNRLGNLSLLSRRINTSIKNSKFEKKKELYANSELFLTRKLTELAKWGPEEVEARQKEMAKLAVGIWTRCTVD